MHEITSANIFCSAKAPHIFGSFGRIWKCNMVYNSEKNSSDAQIRWVSEDTVKILKFGTRTSNNCHNCPRNRKVWCNIALMHPKDADGMANSVDPDQTASSEAVWSWSALFAETYLSQYIEFVRYWLLNFNKNKMQWPSIIKRVWMRGHSIRFYWELKIVAEYASNTHLTWA